jgi:hypothetical protein
LRQSKAPTSLVILVLERLRLDAAVFDAAIAASDDAV